ncbi:hypothetical protein BGZ61DRAFT_487852 [Ilyonectria robusta]|uniref:uncharacterized protein n=1 Tax=Ilyonectria robusta TaxID=1079257 RepID=UPI001E8E66A5|nr:uncharacterized protein BGZ61DRAFT_487852 [Ilyonectria robusta]KAH8650458.1 hypothetical protein BGZ61DRAFT_487852 [Ilyonectria robusta]
MQSQYIHTPSRCWGSNGFSSFRATSTQDLASVFILPRNPAAYPDKKGKAKICIAGIEGGGGGGCVGFAYVRKEDADDIVPADTTVDVVVGISYCLAILVGPDFVKQVGDRSCFKRQSTNNGYFERIASGRPFIHVHQRICARRASPGGCRYVRWDRCEWERSMARLGL